MCLPSPQLQAAPHVLVLPAAAAAAAAVVVLGTSFAAQSLRQLRMRYVEASVASPPPPPASTSASLAAPAKVRLAPPRAVGWCASADCARGMGRTQRVSSQRGRCTAPPPPPQVQRIAALAAGRRTARMLLRVRRVRPCAGATSLPPCRAVLPGPGAVSPTTRITRLSTYM
jgi:hypothetical protein